MADNDKRKFDLPWATLLPLAAVLAGVVAQYKPLVSTRPAVAKEKSVPVIAEQDVDARLWQDPINVAQKQKSSLDEQIDTHVAKKGAEESHKIGALREHLHKRLKTPERILLLAVMVEAGPYSEQGESRLRARPAVLEALSESGFAPLDGEHIGFVTADWPPPNDSSGAPTIERALLIPWEECIAKDPPHAYPKNTRWLIVLWLPAASFNTNPLSRFANIVDQLASDVRDKVDIKLIGPANSTGLQSMVRELRQRSGPPENTTEGLAQNTKNTLNGISIFSPRATASDEWLLFRPTTSGSAPEVRRASTKKTVQELVEEAAPGLQFVRTIAADDVVLKNLIAELARRRIRVQQTTRDARRIPKLAHIVILTEWDTPYGRSLSTIFAAQASGQTISEIVEQPDKWPSWVHPYRYLRGIDGQLPGDQPKEGQHEQAQKTQLGQDTVAIEATEGMNQSDYLRRLARQMKEDNSRWQREDGLGIRAIGLLGSDIYDKLMILRALRPQFRDAVFFTNNYDAHFERRDDWDETRNLIIASPFGSALPETFSRQHIAPFRDTNQTATYVGTLVATGRMKPEEAEYLSWQPRIFEVSRHGAYDLSEPWYLEGKNLSVSNKTWFRVWLFGPGVIWLLIVISLTVLIMAAWISLSIARRTLPGGGTAVQRLKRALVSTTFWLVCGGPLIVFVAALIAQYWGSEEPLIFFSGISIWPTEMVRLIAFLLAIFFMFKASFDLRANARKIEAEFSFTPLPPTRFRWRHLGIGFEHWQMQQPTPTSRFSAEEAWHTYLCRNKFWPRVIRVGILFALYFVFAVAIFSLFPQPPAPGRGEASFKFDTLTFVLGGVGLLLLSFYVVDAIQLNSNFIRMFAREVTKWGTGVIDRSHRSPPLTEEELSAYHEIFFVAQRTQAVAPLVWYPLLVLTLLVVARSSLFDNWTWPASLVLIFVITAAWALGSAILLRRAAEQLRETALNDLRRFRLLGRETEAKRETFDELIGEIRDLKTGAFAPLTEQPFIRAVLFPGGALGLLAVGQRLLDIF
jgi:hypothetical protein